ncbi:hypothetical protein KUCAC02_014304 [Chaenocephalus aceratus]|uniref:Uncharacterized protein n=1 Tax=Chaenocephalus aceratus TaxID=36190 RepID=A0ACB9WES2_CHAAC|nr:hypothetical protein KUCAC02_014304 [Chaenocephalus aceratus]
MTAGEEVEQVNSYLSRCALTTKYMSKAGEWKTSKRLLEETASLEELKTELHCVSDYMVSTWISDVKEWASGTSETLGLYLSVRQRKQSFYRQNDSSKLRHRLRRKLADDKKRLNQEILKYNQLVHDSARGIDVAAVEHSLSGGSILSALWPWEVHGMANFTAKKKILDQVMLTRRLQEEKGILLLEMAQHCTWLQNMAVALKNKVAEEDVDKGNGGLGCTLRRKHAETSERLQVGLALRGHDSDEGNLWQLLRLRSGDDDVLKRWLSKPSNNYTSAVIQNEVLNIIANSIVRRITIQTYDGAANISGESKGVQALLREKQPLALYVHCGPHCVNLVTQTACSSSSVVSDALNLVHKLGTLYHQSGKYDTIFKEIAQSEAGSLITLKPLCPTRWLVRLVAIQAVVGKYEKVLLSLEEMAASEALKELECFNRSLQSKTGSVTGMLAAVDCVKKTLRVKRSGESFHQIYARACDMISEMGIETIQMPHIRIPPKRYTGNAAAFTPASTEEHSRIEFFKVLDAVDVQLTKRFDQSSFDTLNKLERVLVSGR